MIRENKLGRWMGNGAICGLLVMFAILIWQIASEQALQDIMAQNRSLWAAQEGLTAELDLNAQQQMALWAKWMFWATAFGVLLSAAALVGLWTTVRQTREAIADNRRLAEAQTRAYVHAKHARHSYTDRGYGFVIELVNVGQTPAAIFQIGGEFRKIKYGELQNTLKNRRTYKMKAWTTLGVGDPLTVRLDSESFQELIETFYKRQDDYVLLVNGTIQYQDVFDQWFETDFAFWSYTSVSGPENTETKLRRPTAKLRAYKALK